MNALTRQDLLRVRKPIRYTGGEWNEKKKSWKGELIKFALAFPDVYEIGMSHLGSRLLYHCLNELPSCLCERVFAPWIDLEAILRRKNIPLFSLESHRPIRDFDFLGFSLSYELNYTNILNMLELSGIEIYAQRRTDGPLVMAGGLGAFMPELLAPFIDIFVIGDGEEVIVELVKTFLEIKNKKISREEKLLNLAEIPGLYLPRFYSDTYRGDNTLEAIRPLRPNLWPRIIKRVVKDLNEISYPTEMLVPFTEIVHDRYVLEIMRGCTRGCRFCQAGFLYRPVRERKVDNLVKLAQEGIKKTGYEELSLVSLSSGDYSRLADLLKSLVIPQTSISLSSLQAENITPEVLLSLKQSTFTLQEKKHLAGITFAPETGEVSLSQAINKKFDYKSFVKIIPEITGLGFRKIKLYFMLGLPGESENTTAKIYELVMDIWTNQIRKSGTGLSISVSNFIPKAHTPFQWEKMAELSSLKDRQLKLKGLFSKNKRIKFNYHDLTLSFLEAVLSRGDRRLSLVLYEAWRRGARFDSWRECFHFPFWQEAFKAAAIDPFFYSHRERREDEVLPWDHIDTGLDKAFLLEERKKAGLGIETPDCRKNCPHCGLCPNLGVKNILTCQIQ